MTGSAKTRDEQRLIRVQNCFFSIGQMVQQFVVLKTTPRSGFLAMTLQRPRALWR